MEEGAIEELVNVCGGDLRKSITLLQSMASVGQEVKVADVHELSGKIPDAEINSVIQAAKSLNPEKVRRNIY